MQQNIQEYKFNDTLDKIIDNAVTDLPESVQEKTKQFLTMAEADKRGTVKNIHATNQGNKVVGQIQSMYIMNLVRIKYIFLTRYEEDSMITKKMD